MRGFTIVGLCLLSGLVAQHEVGAQAGQQIAPQLQQGQSWQVQSQQYQMQTEAPPQWSPPVQWRYEVVGRTQAAGQACRVIEVTQQGAARPVMTLKVAQRDMQLIEVQTMVQVGGRLQPVTTQLPDGIPVLGQLGPAPCQLPVFPLQAPQQAQPGERAMAVTTTHRGLLRSMDGPALASEVTQTVEPVGVDQIPRAPGGTGLRSISDDDGALLKVTLRGAGVRSMQMWRADAPWPLYSETDTQRAWLVGYSASGE